MTARKIVIEDCGECPYDDHKGGFGRVSYIPVCRKANREPPWKPEADRYGFVRARREPGIPDWCPLQEDAASQPESFMLNQVQPRALDMQVFGRSCRPDGFKPQAASDTQPVAVSHTITLLDAREFKPPKDKKILCGSALRFGTTVIGLFDGRAHDCWLPMPGFPASLKGRR